MLVAAASYQSVQPQRAQARRALPVRSSACFAVVSCPAPPCRTLCCCVRPGSIVRSNLDLVAEVIQAPWRQALRKVQRRKFAQLQATAAQQALRRAAAVTVQATWRMYRTRCCTVQHVLTLYTCVVDEQSGAVYYIHVASQMQYVAPRWLVLRPAGLFTCAHV